MGFNKPNKTSHAFHEPLYRPGGVPQLCHAAGVRPPTARLQPTFGTPEDAGHQGQRRVKGKVFPPPTRFLPPPHTGQRPPRGGLGSEDLP